MKHPHYNPNIGEFENQILFEYESDEELNALIDRCDAWRKGREVVWVNLPPRYDAPLTMHGFIGGRVEEGGLTQSCRITLKAFAQ